MVLLYNKHGKLSKEEKAVNFKNFIESKKDGELSYKQIKSFVDSFMQDKLSEKQVVEFIKVSAKYGCTNAEVYNMAKCMAETGTQLKISDELGFCVDKHSAGTVSDGTSLILLSALASLGIPFVKVVSNTYGNHGSMFNKLNMFKGFNAYQTKAEVAQRVKECGVGIVADTGNIAPAAAKMYNICKQHGLMPEQVVASSIMANKIATGASLVVVDVKSGEGSVVGSANAEALAKRLVEVGKLAGIKTIAVVTDFNWPISAAVGAGLELQEIKDTLSNAKEYIGSNLLKLAKEMVTCVLMSCERATTRSQAAAMFDDVISSGAAYNQFCKIISSYGGDFLSFDRTEKLIDTAVSYITADYSGFIGDIKLDELYKAVEFIISHKGEVDKDAGLVLMCAEGDRVTEGQKLAKIFYSHDNNRYFKVAQELYDSFKITKEKPSLNNLFIKVEV